MATDAQLFNQYLRTIKQANVLVNRETRKFLDAFGEYVAQHPRTNISTLFDRFYDQYNFGAEMVTITQASEIKQAAIGYNMRISTLNLLVENTNDELMRDIFGKTNGNRLSRNIYNSVDDTRKIITRELARLDEDVVGFKNSVKNLQSAIGGNIDQQKQVAGYMRDLEIKARKVARLGSDEAMKDFRKAVRVAESEIVKLTENRRLGSRQRGALRDIVRGVEQKLPEILERGVKRAIFAKNESQMERLVNTENTRVYHQAEYNERVDKGNITAVKFTLAASHRIVDQCDVIASYNGFGLGAGVFPLNQQPRLPIHPNGQSYMRSITRRKITPLAAKEAGIYNSTQYEKQGKKAGLQPSQVKSLKELKQMKYANINTDKLKSL